jgi:succinate dehydrogenase / fumarate reductase cytochrome b subunit
MAVSITVRMTGVGLYFGALLAAAWAIALASGPQAYAEFKALVGSIPGKLVMIGLTFSYFFHFGGGIRHLVFDAGYGFSPKAATQSAAAVAIFAVAATAVTWLFAYLVGVA